MKHILQLSPTAALALLLASRGAAQNTFPATGNVGIGTSSPQAALDIGVHTSDGAVSVFLARQWEGDGVGGGTSLNIRAWATQVSSYNGKSFSLEHSFHGIKNSAVNFYRGSDRMGGFMTFETNSGNEQMRIDPYGNVGIGTASPSNKLTVNGDGRFEQGVYAASVGFRLMASSTDLVNASTWYGLGRSNLILPGGTANAASVQVAGYFGVNLKTAQGDMAMLSNGNVGIGTLTPTAKLAVNGNVKAREVNVTVDGSDWPDYVFRKSYRLPSLDSLSACIESLGRLPGIPSAEEIKTKGLDLGEMNRKLLEKVEELTLLLIEQGKKTEALQRENRDMRLRVQKLEDISKNNNTDRRGSIM